MSIKKFPEKFWWGAATSGVQSEGSKDQINESIWQYWYNIEPERFALNIGPDKVCNSYEKYIEDIELAKKIGLNSLRTSIQWSRFIKDFETGEIDTNAEKFYFDYFKKLKDSGIEPVINLYHFDMPKDLQLKYGGFESKHVVDLYLLYAKKVFESFSEIVTYFVTFNEPIVPVEMGYFYGQHFPATQNPKVGVLVAYNTLLAHAKVTKYYKENYFGEIGVILNLTPTYSKSDSVVDKEAANIADLFFNRSFLDPIVSGKFPRELVQILKKHSLIPEIDIADIRLIKNSKIDFLGVNYYVPRRVMHKEFEGDKFTKPENYFEYYKNENGRFNKYRDNNEIYPEAIYDVAKNIQNNYGNIKWYLAEIGIAMDLKSEGDEINGVIDDSYRIELLREHFIYLHKAIEEGSNCFGVHMWTFIDCWSWLNSFIRRYGFYRLDLETGNRIPKKSSEWISKVAKNNGFDD